jgi:hypothetical protein
VGFRRERNMFHKTSWKASIGPNAWTGKTVPGMLQATAVKPGMPLILPAGTPAVIATINIIPCRDLPFGEPQTF